MDRPQPCATLSGGECAEGWDGHAGDVVTAEQVSFWRQARRLGLAAELDVVAATWATRGLAVSTLNRLSWIASRFCMRLSATGVTSLLDVTPQDCEDFAWAPTKRRTPPTVSTVHLRRTALHGLFSVLRELEDGFADPSLGMELPPRGPLSTRPLDHDEIRLVRTAAAGRARHSGRATAAVALTEATATTSELARLRWCDVDLQRGTVTLPGAGLVRPRTGQLSAWGRAALTAQSEGTDPHPPSWVVDRRVPYDGDHTAQAAMANLLGRVLAAAGLGGRGIKPTSIRLWGAARIRDRHGIEAAAGALGFTSLDATARIIDYDPGGQ